MYGRPGKFKYILFLLVHLNTWQYLLTINLYFQICWRGSWRCRVEAVWRSSCTWRPLVSARPRSLSAGAAWRARSPPRAGWPSSGTAASSALSLGARGYQSPQPDMSAMLGDCVISSSPNILLSLFWTGKGELQSQLGSNWLWRKWITQVVTQE